jgi:hypothetical protein
MTSTTNENPKQGRGNDSLKPQIKPYAICLGALIEVGHIQFQH